MISRATRDGFFSFVFHGELEATVFMARWVKGGGVGALEEWLVVIKVPVGKGSHRPGMGAGRDGRSGERVLVGRGWKFGVHGGSLGTK